MTLRVVMPFVTLCVTILHRAAHPRSVLIVAAHRKKRFMIAMALTTQGAT
ncbi:hypothetical protein PSE10B_32260 [Pseudomonas amygdali pv. eriobotryae]|nr:hypothetical protein PSE10B_32260 [Pseudomonas amygdali pv. eriobotryae]